MNFTTQSVADLAATNRYAGWLIDHCKRYCRDEGDTITSNELKREFLLRVGAFSAGKLAAIPCVIANPGAFFINFSVCALVGGGVGLALEVRHPSTVGPMKAWCNWFACTALLNEKPRQVFHVSDWAYSCTNFFFSCVWAKEMAWLNGALLGGTLAYNAAAEVARRYPIADFLIDDPTLHEPLLDHASRV